MVIHSHRVGCLTETEAATLIEVDATHPAANMSLHDELGRGLIPQRQDVSPRSRAATHRTPELN